MKTLLLLLAAFFFIQSAFSQPGDYAGPAKGTVKAFWDGATKLEQSIAGGGSSLDADRLTTLQKKIVDTKIKDVAYNTAAMEEKFKILAEGIEAIKKKKEQAGQAFKEKLASAGKISSMLNDLFHYSTQVSNRDLPGIKERLGNYKKLTNELLALDRTGNKNELDVSRNWLKRTVINAEKNLYELDRRCREQTVAENASVQYYELLFTQAYWDAAQKVYPEEADFKKAYGIATKLLDGLGTLDDVYKLAAKSKQQKINDTRLPAAAVKDAALEKMFVDAFNKYQSEGFKGTAIKAVVMSEDWSILRHEITGIVTGRARRAVIVYKGADGKCYLTGNFFIHQKYVGNSFSSAATSPYMIIGSQEMLCENVK